MRYEVRPEGCRPADHAEQVLPPGGQLVSFACFLMA